jgi:hypothetical protein
MLKLLLARGAQSDAVDSEGFSALDYAVMGRHGANAAFLKSLGLQPAAKARQN